MSKRGGAPAILASVLTGAVLLPACVTPAARPKPRPLAGRDTQIVVNQVGYYVRWPKVAFLLNARVVERTYVDLVDVTSEAIIARISPRSPLRDKRSGDIIQDLDFTAVNSEGQYYLRYGELSSVPFRIGQDIYYDPLFTMLRSFYLQRCGINLDDVRTGVRHLPCHVDDAVIAHGDPVNRAGTLIHATGGWHDAGDYGKYIATAAVVVGRLLSLYEQHPSLFTDNQLMIPEAGNGVPDLLDEVRVGIEWMLTMQRADGAVYRKLAGTTWPLHVLPDQDTQPRFVYGVSTPETAKFAAAVAMAARVYAKVDAAFARRCRRAAESAWEFLQRAAFEVDWHAEDDRGSGKYLLSDVDQEDSLATDSNDRFWAAVELLITTGQPRYRSYVTAHLLDLPLNLFEWKNPVALGMTDYLWHGQKRQDGLVPQIESKIVARADILLGKIAQNGYQLANDRFVWGSNKMTAEEGITLFQAYRISKNPAYLHAALAQVDYLFGRNHFNQTFVSGVGTRPVRHVAHIFARTGAVDIPGLVVGGPNELAQCGIAPKGRGPLSYIDDERSYATNENAIDYNASLIALVGMLMAEAQAS